MSRRPRLRCVSHNLGGTPRHRASFVIESPSRILDEYFAVEVWTGAEWRAMTEGEREPEAAFLRGPDVWVHLRRTNKQASDEIAEENADRRVIW